MSDELDDEVMIDRLVTRALADTPGVPLYRVDDPAAFWRSLTPAQSRALLAAAPLIAAPWESYDGRPESGAARPGPRGALAVVYGRRNGDDGDERTWHLFRSGRLTELGHAPSLAAAKAECDRQLIASGWLLDDSEAST